jgi:hypothetical protein
MHETRASRANALKLGEIAPMSTDQNSSPGHSKKNEDNLLKAITLLALPWLNFQGKVLDAVKAGIQDASNIKPFKTLALHELHALAMILDPEGKWRNAVGTDFERKFEDIYNKAVAKIASGSISFIEAQQALVTSLIDAANKGRSETPSKRDKK